MSTYREIKKSIKQYEDKERAVFFKRFFKTAVGEYGEGDKFIGLTVPQSRRIAKQFSDMSLKEIKRLLDSSLHEERLIALFILVLQFAKANSPKREEIFSFYLKHTDRINNWDLVDSSADKIIGEYLLSNPKKMKILQTLAYSENLWEKRIAMIATYQFIKKGDAVPALTIAEILIHDTHDLIQKAVGWMLREVGKRCSLESEEVFLRKYYKTMPRTALRYAIERFPIEKRKQYLSGNV